MAKMPLKILGSFIMFTALILIGNPSCELEEERNSQTFHFVFFARAFVNIPNSADTTEVNRLSSRGPVVKEKGLCLMCVDTVTNTDWCVGYKVKPHFENSLKEKKKKKVYLSSLTNTGPGIFFTL